MSKSKSRYAVELDGVFYECSENKAEQIVDLRDIKGDRWLVSDFDGAVSRSVTMEAPVKYVEVMLRKSLQETGEFDEPVTVMTHWKKRRGPNATDIFFTALPTRLYFQYLDQVKAYGDNLLIFPLYSVLFAVLRRMRQTDPSAVVFHHGRFVDLIVGTPKKIHFAGRCMAFDESAEQISSLWNMVNSDIRNTEKENRIEVGTILTLNWVDSMEEPQWPEELQGELCAMEEETVSLNGQDYSVSFPKALRMLSGGESVSGKMEKTVYYCSRSLPFLSALMMILTVLFFAGYVWYDREADRVQAELNEVTTQIANLRREVPPAEVPYKKTLGFVRDLEKYRDSPPLKRLINDISGALVDGMTVDSMKADYNKNEVSIEALAKVDATFEAAYSGYQRFMSSMRLRGYDVGESEFNTSVQESRFLIRLKKRIK